MLHNDLIRIGKYFKNCGSTHSLCYHKVCKIIEINSMGPKVKYLFNADSLRPTVIQQYSFIWFKTFMESAPDQTENFYFIFWTPSQKVAPRHSISTIAGALDIFKHCNSDYVMQAVVSKGGNALCEVNPNKEGLYVLWNPASTKPPKKTFSTLEKALEAKNRWYLGKYCMIMMAINRVSELDWQELKYAFGGLSDAADALQYSCDFSKTKEEKKMKVTFVLQIGDKAIEINEDQANRLGGVGKYDFYRIREALDVDGRLFKANEIELTEVEKDEAMVIVVE